MGEEKPRKIPPRSCLRGNLQCRRLCIQRSVTGPANCLPAAQRRFLCPLSTEMSVGCPASNKWVALHRGQQEKMEGCCCCFMLTGHVWKGTETQANPSFSTDTATDTKYKENLLTPRMNRVDPALPGSSWVWYCDRKKERFHLSY